jgi:hypothetical protein
MVSPNELRDSCLKNTNREHLDKGGCGIPKDADLLVDDYRYLEPDDDLSCEEYGEFLKDRFHDLADVAHMYGRFYRDRGAKYSGRLEQNWKRYLEAADTVHRVYHELHERKKIEGDSR